MESLACQHAQCTLTANLAAEVPSLAVSYLVCLEHGASRQPLATSKTRVDICWFTVGGQPMLEGKVIFQAMFPPEPEIKRHTLEYFEQLKKHNKAVKDRGRSPPTCPSICHLFCKLLDYNRL